ncbi:hypothetical protein HDU96_005082, partial [Phlyctochytrium bullatum]
MFGLEAIHGADIASMVHLLIVAPPTLWLGYLAVVALMTGTSKKVLGETEPLLGHAEEGDVVADIEIEAEIAVLAMMGLPKWHWIGIGAAAVLQLTWMVAVGVVGGKLEEAGMIGGYETVVDALGWTFVLSLLIHEARRFVPSRSRISIPATLRHLSLFFVVQLVVAALRPFLPTYGQDRALFLPAPAAIALVITLHLLVRLESAFADARYDALVGAGRA